MSDEPSSQKPPSRIKDLLWDILGTLISAFLIFVISNLIFGEKVNSIVEAITNPPKEYKIYGIVDDKNNVKIPNITVSIVGQQETISITDSLGYYELVTQINDSEIDSIRIQLYDKSRTYKPLNEVYFVTSDEKITKQINRNYVLQFR